jgi:hypothetical protein
MRSSAVVIAPKMQKNSVKELKPASARGRDHDMGFGYSGVVLLWV